MLGEWGLYLGARVVAGAELNIHRSLNLPIVDVFGKVWLAGSGASSLTAELPTTRNADGQSVS